MEEEEQTEEKEEAAEEEALEAKDSEFQGCPVEGLSKKNTHTVKAPG